MARKRMIDPGIWESEDFGRLSTLAKLVFIGLFSNADDEGRGRANPILLRSILFPYEESMRSADIEKALLEISTNMSVIFYSCDGSNYYSLYNWDTWQKIDKPTDSKIPAFDKENKKISLLFDECSTSVRRAVAPNKKRIEKNKNRKEEKEFSPPTLQEVKTYVKEKKLNVDSTHFYNYFTEGKWVDSNGKKVKNWKQKILTWNGYSKPEKAEKKAYKDYEQREYNDLENLYANVRGGKEK